ncbi:MAG: hypothetical protein A2Y94_01945 [Caldithrix sp. RBG_13_44_9]|nr:MAG: hypothetical protein A2Y94_01945 [Caldithrix sp. RBG_13_44_9]
MQKRSFYFNIFIWLVTVVLISCSENPHQLTVNVLNSEIPGFVKDTTLLAVQDTSYQVKTKVNTQYSYRLLLGGAFGLEARPILRFTSYLTVPDSAIVDSAKIQLSAAGSVSPGTPTFIDATIYPIVNIWTTNVDSVWGDYLQNIDRNKPLGQLEINPSDTLDYIFNLNSDGIEMVKVWADTATDPVDNYGVIIDFDQADFIQYLYAINSTKDPQLIISYHLPGDTAVYGDTLNGTYDAYVYEGSIPRIDERNYASSLIVNNTLLKFDLAGFLANQPSEISLISANLQIPVDMENSLVDPNYGLANQVTLKLITDINNPAVEVDSTKGLFAITTYWASDSSYIETSADASRKMLAEMIRQQLVQPADSNGFVISFIDSRETSSTIIDEIEFYSYLAYYKRTHPNPANHPRLKITYWIPASSRL